MSMPNDLLLVRHGQSEGNVATDASKAGDNRWYTDQFMTTPGHQWRLTDLGRAQASVIGAWITLQFPTGFDRYLVSPYVRARETAGHLLLPGAQWMLNRALRERDWGDIGSLPRDEFEARPEYALNAHLKRVDPLYWVAPNGESVAHVAEDRVRNVLDTLHRECSGERVVAVTHGDVMGAFRLVLERMDDETFLAVDSDPAERVHNCEVLHYSRVSPFDGSIAPRLAWLRRAYPAPADGGGPLEVKVGRWQSLEPRLYSNGDLLVSVEDVPSLLAE